MSPLTHGCAGYTPKDRSPVEEAIGGLQHWIDMAEPAVARESVLMVHAELLGLMPRSLNATLSLCDAVTGLRRDYKSARDAQSAAVVLAMRDLVPSRKLILWAHISHLSYEHDTTNASLGKELRRSLGERLYTMLPLASSGGALVVFDDRTDDIGYLRRFGPDGSLAQAFSGKAAFMDLRSAPAGMGGLQPLWIESRVQRRRPADLADGVIWIRAIHPPHWPVGVLIAIGSLHYRRAAAIAAGAITVIALLAAARWRLSRRRRRASCR
jgi:hypothetical protein